MLIQNDKIDTVAIGGFDGIHLGHIQLIKKLGNWGALVVIDKDNANLTPMSKRKEYSKHPCMFYHFSKVKDLSGEEFITLLKKDFPNLNKIIVGYDFVFGVNRSCKAKDLKTLFDKEVEIIDEFKYKGISVHSTIIRQSIKEGNITLANQLLGREYLISGDIIKGQGLGKKELFPTINLRIHNYLLPKQGVYATRSIIDGITYNSVSFIGIRLSVDGKFSVETHIIDNEVTSNSNWAELVFVDFIRENQKFDDLKVLKNQINKDIETAKTILEKNNG